MNIWIDLSNSPHVNFFSGLIRELQERHSVTLTCRPLANTMELLQQTGFPYHVIGRHYGRQPARKLIGFGIQTAQLCGFLKGRNIAVGMSHSSFYAPLAARLLGIRSIYINDNEHAQGNRLAFLFADKILMPEFLDPAKFFRQGARPDKIISYPGVKEGIYLWDYRPSQCGPLPLPKPHAKTIFVRPEPQTAQYYGGGLNFLDDLLRGLRENYNVIVLPRSREQESYYRMPGFAGVYVPSTPMHLSEIMENCDLFIGAGGTMTREAAVLGIPTISVYQDKLLDVDSYLIAKGAMIHIERPDTLLVTGFLESNSRRSPDRVLLEKGRQAYNLLIDTVLSDGKGGKDFPTSLNRSYSW